MRWITTKRTLRELSRESGRSIGTLRHLFYTYLEHPPYPQPVSNQKSILIIDGTWFGHEHCLIVYYDTIMHRVQYWRYTLRENAPEITQDLETLRGGGVIVQGATTDGSKGPLLALNTAYPAIPKQRCLVHLQRLSLAWLTLRPKTQAGRELRALALVLNRIKTKRQRNQWIRAFTCWNERYAHFLRERTVGPDGKWWWYTHKMLRKVRRYFLNALPSMFLYLNHPRLPKDTNMLEGGIFSPLKEIYRSHRGISEEKRSNFLAWYLYLKYQKRK